jgi:haloalkane dehalogenase
METTGKFIRSLDLERLTLVCQDWGGPIGLRQALEMPERFERLCALNTWLHHPGYEYSPGIRRWRSLWDPGGSMDALQGCGVVMQNWVSTSPRGAAEPLTPEQAFAAYEAPFPDRASKAGPRRFPHSLPIDNESVGNAAVQARDFEHLKRWQKPIYFIWGIRDPVFTEEWGRSWAAMMPQATFDPLEAGHFLQESHGAEAAALLLARVDSEAR